MGINIIRENILLKGYTNLQGIRNFIPCGHTKATRIQEAIKAEILAEGKSIEFGVDPKRLLKYVNLTKKEIFTNADVERKNESAITDSRCVN